MIIMINRIFKLNRTPTNGGKSTNWFAGVSLLALLASGFAPSHAQSDINAPPVPVLKWSQFPGEPIGVFAAGESRDPDGNIVSYSWNFGDGSTASGPDAGHFYSAPGKYLVTLTVTDNREAVAATTVEIDIAGKTAPAPDTAANTPPVPVHTHEQFTGHPIMVFHGGASHDKESHIARHHWDFGDGQQGEGMDVAHDYGKPGTYEVTFTVTDANGSSASSTFSVAVAGKPPAAPVAHASATPVDNTLSVQFNGSGSRDEDGSIVSWTWDFGDGAGGSGAQASHAYAAAGQYPATLTVIDDSGMQHTVAVPVTVSAPVNQPPQALASVARAGSAFDFSFDAGASLDPDGRIASVSWDFGDGNGATGMTATHRYAAAGSFRAAVTVTDDHGASARYELQVTAGDAATSGKVALAYYDGGLWRSYQPQHVDLSAMTHLIFGRVVPGGGNQGGQAGGLLPGAGAAHEAGQLPSNVSRKSVEAYLIERARAAGVIPLLMVGGYDVGAGFLNSTDPALRAGFVDKLLAYVVANGYQGVDLNWVSDMDDVVAGPRLVALIRELKARAAQMPQFQAPHKPLLVTYPTNVLNMNTDSVAPWKVEVAGLVDYLSLTSYQMGFWSGGQQTWHFSPLYRDESNWRTPTSIDSTVRALVAAGVPAQKIVLGVGFFGYSFARPVSGPYQEPEGVDHGNNDLSYSWSQLVQCGYLSTGTYVFDNDAKASYRSYNGFNAGGVQGECINWAQDVGWLSYEDQRSISAKSRYVREQNLAGVTAYKINFGTVDGITNPLLSAVKHSVVQGSDTLQPMAVVSSEMTSATALRYQFNGTASTDSNGAPVSTYAWNFGDGSTSSEASPLHTYREPGTYQVTLAVIDATGAGSTTLVRLHAELPPPPDVMPPLEPVAAQPGAKPWVTSYYAGYFWDNGMLAPWQVDFSTMTHYVFARVAPGAGSLGGQPGEVLNGGGSAHHPGALGSRSPKSVEDWMIERARNAGVKAILMLGGMGDGRGFYASTDPRVRPAFVNNLLDYLEAHGYDGIDVDWEDHLESTTAKFRLTALIADLRAAAKLRARWQAPNAPILITFPSYAVNVNPGQNAVGAHDATIASIVDQYNLMSYSLVGNWPGWTAGTASPIAGHTRERPMDLSSSIDLYVSVGVDPKKIGIGVGFYGTGFAMPVTGMDHPAEGVRFNNNDVDMNYRGMKASGYVGNTRCAYTWVELAEMAYYACPEGFAGTGPLSQEFGMYSFNDPASIVRKGQWVKSRGLGGGMVWLINYDSNELDLSRAMKQGFID
jgi:chitinase